MTREGEVEFVTTKSWNTSARTLKIESWVPAKPSIQMISLGGGRLEALDRTGDPYDIDHRCAVLTVFRCFTHVALSACAEGRIVRGITCLQTLESGGGEKKSCGE